MEAEGLTSMLWKLSWQAVESNLPQALLKLPHPQPAAWGPFKIVTANYREPSDDDVLGKLLPTLHKRGVFQSKEI